MFNIYRQYFVWVKNILLVYNKNIVRKITDDKPGWRMTDDKYGATQRGLQIVSHVIYKLILRSALSVNSWQLA